MRYFLHLAYLGTAYHGWQRQKDVVSVQEVLEDVLSSVFKTKIILHGCGRTDAGVHASQYFAHADFPISCTEEHVQIINRQLPGDISLFEFIPVPDKANAQTHAITRTYLYKAHFFANAMLHNRSGHFTQDLPELELMQEAAAIACSTSEFRFSCKTPDRHKKTICVLQSLQITQSQTQFQFQFTADHFLRGMIRILVQRLIDTGTGKYTVAQFEEITKGVQTDPYLKMAPACGLYLSRISYDRLSPKEFRLSL